MQCESAINTGTLIAKVEKVCASCQSEAQGRAALAFAVLASSAIDRERMRVHKINRNTNGMWGIKNVTSIDTYYNRGLTLIKNIVRGYTFTDLAENDCAKGLEW